jgi:hypothetical protein
VSVTDPWTSPIVRTPWTDTVSVQTAVWATASSLVAVTLTAYEPAGTPASTVTVASAVPPTAAAGVKAVRAIVPAAGAGETPVTSTSTTVPSGSVAVTTRLAAVPATVASGPPQVTVTGWFPAPGSKVWAPSPSSVLSGKPSHSAAGSKGLVPSVSPAEMVAWRRIVLSDVLVAPVPHSVPGSTPIWPMTSTGATPLRRTTASSPFQLATAGASWSAWATMAGSASARVTTYTSPSATVPVSATVWEAAPAPLLYSSSV